MIETVLAAFLGAAIATLVSEIIRAFVRRGQSVEVKRDCILTELLNTIEELKSCSLRFWCVDASELGDQFSLLQAQILGQQHHILECISLLFTGIPKRECDMAATTLFKAVSSKDFDDPNRKVSKEALRAIHVAALSLRLSALNCRNNLPRPPLS